MKNTRSFGATLTLAAAGMFVLVGATVAGCNKGAEGKGAGATAESPAVNSVCPIMTTNKVDPKNVPANLTRVFKGQKVGFCCGGCPAAWDKLTDEQKEQKLKAIGVNVGQPTPAAHGSPGAAMNMAVVNARCPIMQANKLDVDNVPANLTRDFKGQKVGFCCGGCPAAWDKLTDEQKAEKLAAVK